MKKIFKILGLFIVFFFFLKPVLASPISTSTDNNIDLGVKNVEEESSINNSAQARVLKILKEKKIIRSNGSESKQQNVQLKILTGPLTGNIVEYQGISNLDIINSNIYKPGDKVIINYSSGLDGKNVFYIMNYVREGSLLWLVLLFIFVVLLIGKGSGFKAILSLFLSFLIIVKIIVPLILQGFNPLVVGALGSFIILLTIVYITGGINKKSHIALLSIFISLLITAFLAVLFSNLAHLTGTAQEEIIYLIQAGPPINFKGLLLAAIIIGTLGVLDDIVIEQVEVVNQIRTLNPHLPLKKTFLMSMKVGRAHLGAVVNTLFLAYVGVSLPLILVINLHQTPFVSFFQIINNEQIATEIVRTLVGVIGLSLAVPITTWLAAYYLPGENKRQKK